MNHNQDEVGPNVFEQIKTICRDYRRELKQGEPKTIENFLVRIDESAQENLFQNLLHIDIEFRRQKGESPQSSDYAARFPKFNGLIRQAFFEDSFDSKAEPSVVDSADFASPQGSFDSLNHQAVEYSPTEMPAARRIGEYELIRELGRGGMGIVYEARHLHRQNRVALKTLPIGVDGQKINAERLHKFRNEFRSLSDIYHPNLVGMQTLEVDGSKWFFTMDLIDGVDILEYVRPHGELDEKRLRDAIRQLVTGIIFLHECGIVHRDLKPSNVLVDQSGCVKLLDFGLVAQLQQSADHSATLSTAHFAGTPRYAAPEQMFGERTKATDWYALGTMLYESLTGSPPFSGRQMEVLKQKQTQDPPTLSDNPSVPEDLASLADNLLKREPELRPTTAQIISALELDLETRSHGSTHDSQGSSGSVEDEQLELETPEEEIILIGREKQLAELETAKSEVLEKRQPLIVWITGKSGEGKSSVAEKFLQPLRKGKEMLVLSGRCYDRESVPFKAVDCIVESLVRYLRSSHGKWLKEEQPEDVEFLAQIFPLLRRVDWIAERDIHDLANADPQKIRGRAFYGLRQLLSAIGQRTAVVIHIDDLQWGDADSARAWHEILNHSEAPPILVLGSYRSDEAAESPFLNNWNQLEESPFHSLESRSVSVVPLSQEECLDLAVIRTGLPRESIEQQIGQLFQETDGNPYFLDQLLEGYDPTTGDFRHLPLEEIVSGRLSRLPAAATKLLNVVAISGQPIRIAEATMVAGVGNSALATLTHMRSERLVRLIDGGVEPMVETWHDKVRESVLDRLSTEMKQQLHLSLAEEIESKQDKTAEDWLDFLRSSPTPGEYQFNPSDRVLELSRHFAAADDPRAFVYQWLAGELAMRSYSIEEGFELFQQARTRLPLDDDSTLFYRFWMGYGRVSLWHRSTELAIMAYENAVMNATNRFGAAVANAGLEKVYMQLGRFDEAKRWIDRALAELGVRRPQSAFGQILSILFSAFRVLFIPHHWQVATTDERQKNARLEAQVLLDGFECFIEKGFFNGVESNHRLAVAALASGDKPIVASAMAMFAMTWSVTGMGAMMKRFMLSIREKVTNVEDPELSGVSNMWIANTDYFMGRLFDAESRFSEAEDQLARCCRYENLQNCMHMHRHVQAYIGSTSDELAISRSMLELATTIGNFQGKCWGFYDVASACSRAGKLHESAFHIQRANRALPNERYIMTSPIRDSTNGYAHLQCSDYAAAKRLSEFAWSEIKDGWIAIDVTMLCVPILIESLAGPDWLQTLPNQERKPLKQAIRRASVFYWTLPNHQAHLCRVCGRANWRLGKKRKAIRQFEKAVKIAEKKGMRYQQARSLLDLAAVKEQGRNENRSRGIELLKEMESVIPRAESWLLGDQYDETVVAPEFDLEAWEAKNGPISEIG